MSGITTNNPETFSEAVSASKPVLPSIGEENFDPVREIRRLRQDLAHRLELLSSAEIKVEKTETVLEQPLPEPPKFPDSEEKQEQNARSSETVEHFVDRLHQTEHLLSRLRHPLFEKEELFANRVERFTKESDEPGLTPPTVAEVASLPTSVEQSESEPAITEEVATEKSASGWIAILKRANTALVLLGFFGAILGVLYYSRGEVRDVRIGLPLAAAGLALIVIGVGGRLIQEHLNRRDDRRGKLTTAP